jgi:signal transduction histidine kinase
MDMFVLNEEVVLLEMALPALTGAARLEALVVLAWHLRQRDTRRALSLAAAAETQLPSCTLPPARQQQLRARLQLVRGKVKWLFAALDAALVIAADALQEFTRLNDLLGMADAHWLSGLIANDQGHSALRDQAWATAAAQAQRAGDPIRVTFMQANQAQCDAFSDPLAAKACWGRQLAQPETQPEPALAACYYDFWGVVTAQASDFAASIAHWNAARKAALETGQLRRAILIATNIGDNFNNLNDYHSALDWMQRGLDLARPTGWPLAIGGCLLQMGETLRRLGRLQAAQEMLDEALGTLAPVAGSRNYAIGLAYLGDLALDRRNYRGALDSFCQLQRRAEALQHADFQTSAQRGQAHALLQLERPHDAFKAALTALEMARAKNDGYHQIAALKVLAEIHARHPLPPPDDMCAHSTQLHYLHLAQNVAAAINGYTVAGDLLDAVADAHAAVGDFSLAYEVTRAANATREKTHSQEATNRAIAMQVRHQTERAQAESEHHRQLALAEAKRASALQQTNETLEHLGAIGQEITAHLETDAVFQALNRHAHGLLDTSTFRIYLVDADGLGLSSVFGIENGVPLSAHHVPLTSNTSHAARCVRERREILVDIAPGNADQSLIPGTLTTLSCLFGPLMIGQRLLGVMTIQSLQAHAYAERERLIFRSLCAYGAIALDNATTYSQLQEAQSRLVSQEKLAALGALVAGVAHELNTPIGNSMLMTSALQEKNNALDEKISQQRLRESDLTEFLSDTLDTAALIMRGLTNAADLVNSFKQVAVDRTSAQRRTFNLQQTAHEIIATMMNQIRLSGHGIELDIPFDIMMDSYPGALGQVLTNLINNALLHAFDGRVAGLMRLSARLTTPGWTLIEFRDNGLGITEQNMARIFDPFFTTKASQGDSGLGLSIIYNIVTSLLNGKIRVDSTPGVGTAFLIDLPLAQTCF